MANHRARVLNLADGGRVNECTRCGGQTEGFGETLRHVGEPIPVAIPDPEDARAVREAIEDAEAVARDFGVDTGFARAVVEALYAGGRLRRRRGQRHRNLLLEERTPRDLDELDHAERAAGEHLDRDRIPA